MADGLQFLPPNVQSLLNYAQQNSNVIRPAQAMGANNSGSTYGFAPMQQSPQSNVGMPQLQGTSSMPQTQQSTPASTASGGLGSQTGLMNSGIGTGSGALGLGNDQTLSDLGSSIGNGTGTIGQGLGALFSLIGL